MGRDLSESFDSRSYEGQVTQDQRQLFAKLGVARDCEAELAMLLMGAARAGVIRLDRITPFLTEARQPCAHPQIDEAEWQENGMRRCPDCGELVYP